MPTLLVTGANRGLGLEFVRQYAALGWDVIACSRKPDALALREAGGARTEIHALDVADFAAVSALAAALSGRRIDVLVNNAGVAGVEAGTFGAVDAAVWEATFRVNALAPLKVAEAFVGHVAASGQKKLVAISSRLGSIGLNDRGGLYAYRASKAALNMAWKSLSVDLNARGVICAVLHPGWVQTDMGGSAAPVTPPQSVAGMVKQIAALSPADSGAFVNYDGARVEW